MTIEQELIDITKNKVNIEKEGDRQKFLRILLEGIQKLSDKEYKSLSAKALDWYETVAKEIIKDNQAILTEPDATLVENKTTNEPTKEKNIKEKIVNTKIFEVHIELELIKASGISRKNGEDRQKFLKRLVELVDCLDDEMYSNLSKAAGDWVGLAVKAYQGGQELPEIPGDYKSYRKEKYVKKTKVTTGRKIRELVCETPSISLANICAVLEKEEFKCSKEALIQTQNNTLEVLEILESMKKNNRGIG